MVVVEGRNFRNCLRPTWGENPVDAIQRQQTATFIESQLLACDSVERLQYQRMRNSMTGPTILLVEDNRLLRWWMTSSLQYEGWKVTAPQSAQEAVEIAGSRPFDVVITDWRLAEGNLGCEILARVRQRFPRTLAILISAEADSEFANQARACGFDLVIEKPFPVAEIVGAVHHLTQGLPARVAC